MIPLCPLCKTELQVEKEDIHPSYPTYRCPWLFTEYFRSTHYIKYFSADWSYSQYEEEAVVLPYRIRNCYNYREGKSDFGIIQKYQLKKTLIPAMDKMQFVSLIKMRSCIKIPSQERFINRIKTLLLFS